MLEEVKKHLVLISAFWAAWPLAMLVEMDDEKLESMINEDNLYFPALEIRIRMYREFKELYG